MSLARTSPTAWLSPLGVLALGLGSPLARGQANVLMLIADDVGVDKIGAYSEGSQVPPTPNIDSLAANGVLFRNCWSNPVCSSSRATILTGRYSFRTGIGYLVEDIIPTQPLQLSEYIIPEVLDLAQPGLYKHAAIGKWHLGNALVGGPLAPITAGFEYYAGLLANMEGLDNYYSWQKTVQGVTSYTSKYITTDEVDEAINFINGAAGPWYCQVWFFAAHAPHGIPPQALCNCSLPPLLPHGDALPYYNAGVTAMDTEIGRLLTSIDPAMLANTNIVFAGDNGTPEEATVPPFVPKHAKPTMYEGGIRVPLLIKGPSVASPGREVVHLVNTVDFFSTCLNLMDVSPLPLIPPETPIDSISMLPYLQSPEAPALREFTYSELFYDPLTVPKKAIRNSQFKYILQGTAEEFYDLTNDPWEQTNKLLAPMTPFETRSYRKLQNKMAALLAS